MNETKIKLEKSNYNLLLIAIGAIAVALLLRFFYNDNFLNPDQFADLIELKVNNQLNIVEEQAEWLEENYEIEDNHFTKINAVANLPIFIFKNGRLTFWSSYQLVPSYRDLQGSYKYHFISNSQGKFIVRKVTLGNAEAFILLPIYYNYLINNKYVEPGYNKAIITNPNVNIVPPEEGGAHKIVYRGYEFFGLKFQDNYRTVINPLSLLMSLLILVSITLVLVFIYRYILYLQKQGKYDHGLIVLFGTLLLLRVLMLVFDYPASLIAFRLFNSIYYASSIVNPSLGDLLLNLLCVLFISAYLYRYFYRFKSFHRLNAASEQVKAVAATFLITGNYLLLYLIYYIVRALNFHSQWSLDINSSISFSYLKIVSLLIIFLSFVFFLLISFVIYKTFVRLHRQATFRFWFDLAVGILIFVTIGLVFKFNFILIAIVGTIYFMSLYLLNLPVYLNSIQYKTIFYLFTTAVAFALVGSYSIYTYDKEKEENRRERLADQLLMDHDYHGEYLLFEALEKIESDILIKSRMLNPFFQSTDVIKQKIKRVYLNNYFDKYEINIYLFGTNGEMLNQPISELNFYELKEKYKAFSTDYDNIYFINQRDVNIPKKYLAFVPIERLGYNIGNILIELNLKRLVPNSVYPELLIDQSYLQPYFYNNEFKDYSYAVFEDGQAIFSTGNFNYSNLNKSLFDEEEFLEQGVVVNDLLHYGKQSDSRLIVVSSQPYPFFNYISNFSFIFLLIIFCNFLLFGAYAIYFSFSRVNLNYAAKIQLYSNFAFFLPLLVVSITTLSLLISSNHREVQNEYLAKAENISYELVDPLYQYSRNRLAAGKEELTSQLIQIASYSGVDINLFNMNGRLIASSQPMIYENHLLSEYINPGAMAQMIEQQNNSVILDESVGELTYKSTYVTIKYLTTGENIGILSIPFFESKLELDNQIIDIFTYIINIFTIIFIIFLIISYFASKWLTFPLRLITQKIRKTTLAEVNEPLTWNSDDEIGLLIKEYNKMLENLEESKKALARSQKESAWREIARQVAHEIKNPLTPMKLTLQHLKRMMESDTSSKDNIATRPINTLLHQIDTLSDIAESFSAFAKMPIPESERFEINTILKKTISLYQSREEGHLETSIPDGSFYVIGDEQWMGRIFSNLIINGFQSVPEEREPIVKVIMQSTGSKLSIEIRDNGTGISEDIVDKIFIPNFSTKAHGSGIGLAVAKRGVEHAGGKIWFETEENTGTSFFIELPLDKEVVR